MPLKVSDGMSAWIKDFKKSDAPQFKGKSPEERREMAIAAYLSAKDGGQQENSDAVKAFLAKGGKIKRLPPGKAQGYHGKDDPAKGVRGILNRPDSKRMGTRKKVRSMESVNEEMMFKVNVEGLPPMIMLGKSPADIKGQLRKIVKQPSMIGDIDRMTKAEVKKRYRDMGAGKGDDEEA